MDYQKQRELYMKAAREHLDTYGVTDYSDHILQIVASVMMHRDDFQMGGGFVEAICNNDLRGAISRADAECTKHLRVIALAHPFAFIQQSK
jgi:hypothetical protein